MKDLRITRPLQVVDDPAYLAGKAKNVTNSGDGTGTPWSDDVINDQLFGVNSAILAEAGMTPNGLDEKAGQSQIVTAIKKISEDKTRDITASNLTLAEAQASNLKVGQRVQLTDYANALYEVVVDSDTGGFYAATLNNGLKLALRDFSQIKNFGVKDGVDSTSELQAAFDFICNNDVGSFDFSCDTLISSPLVYNGNATRKITGFMRLTVTASMTEALTIDNTLHCLWDAVIEIVGGGATYSGRLLKNGVIFGQAARMRIETVNVLGCQRDGVAFNANGNKNMASIGTLSATWCGTNPTNAAWNLSVTYTGASNSGSGGSTSQRTTLTGMTVPAIIEAGDFLKVNGSEDLHLITSVTSNSLEIYPWVDSAYTSGSVSLIQGCGMRTIGGDSGEIGVDVLDATACGIGLFDGALYGSQIGRFVGQNNGVGVAIGLNTTSSHLGLSVDYAYFESGSFDVVQVTGADEIFATITSPVALGYDKCLRIAPRQADNSFQTGRQFKGVTIIDDVVNSATGDEVFGYVSNQIVDTGSNNESIIKANSVTVTLKHNADKDRLFGKRSIKVYHFGTGADDAPAGVITYTPEDVTWTINGGSAGASFAFSTSTSSFTVMAVADLASKNWIVRRTYTNS